jgi:peptide/nickel transport system permease protein
MAAFVGRRLLLSVITLALVSILVFAATELLPGDTATQLLGRGATPAQLHALRAELGLDHPPITRFLDWVGSALGGNLGRSTTSGQPVASELAPRLRNTLLLAGVTLALGISLAVVCGIVAALTRGRWPDIVISIVSLVFISLPEFVVATVLVLLFAITWPIFPAVTVTAVNAPLRQLLPAVWLPALSLTFIMAAYVIRMLRASLIDAMASEYVALARLKGLSTWRIVFRHALPSALAPTINVVAVIVGWMMGGVIVVESIFNYPGIGLYTSQAVGNRDLPVLQGLALLGAATYVCTSLVADVAVLALNPRLRGRTG